MTTTTTTCGLANIFEERDDPREGLYPGLKQYRASCDCGWHGHWRTYLAAAERDISSHHAEVAALREP